MEYLFQILSPAAAAAPVIAAPLAEATPPPSPTAPTAATSRLPADRRSLLPQLVVETPTPSVVPATSPHASPPTDGIATLQEAALAQQDFAAMQAALDLATAVATQTRLKTEMSAQAADARFQYQELQMVMAAQKADMERMQMAAAHKADMERMKLEMQLAAAHAAAATLASAQAATAQPNSIQAAVPVTPFQKDQAKIIAASLLKLSMSDVFTARHINHGSTIAEIDAIVLTMLNTLSAVPGQVEFSLLLAVIFGLPFQHIIVEPGSITGQRVQHIIEVLAGDAGCAERDDIDTGSSSSSSSSRRPRIDVFSNDQHRAAYAKLVQLLAGNDIPVSLSIMEYWKNIDHGLLGLIKDKVPATTPYMHDRVQCQSSFTAALHQILFLRGQSKLRQLTDCIDDLLGQHDYAGTDGRYDLPASAIMHTFIIDLKRRVRAFKTVEANRDAFCLAESLKSLPTFIGGSLELVFHALKQELNTIAEDSGSMEEMILAIQAAISVLGADELTGDMRAPSPPKKPSARKAAESAMAAIQPIRGGGKSKGKGQAAKPTATVVQPVPAAQAERGPCLAGAACPFFGTHNPCVQTHTKEEMDQMRKALGPKFVNADDRRNRQIQQVEAALNLGPPVAAQPASAASSAEQLAHFLAQLPAQPASATSTAEKAAHFLAQLKAAQAAHPQDGSVPSGAAVTSVPHLALCSVGRIPEKEPSGSIDASILPGYEPGQPPTTINNFYITMPIAKSTPQAEHAANVQQSVSLPPAGAVIDAILYKLAPLCFGDFPACTAVLPPSDRCKTGAGRGEGNTCDGVNIASPETSGSHAAPDNLDGWADDTLWSPGRALRPYEYHRLQQANRAAASYGSERIQSHCFQCPYSLPRHMADGSHSGRCSNFKCPCGRK